MHLRRTIARLTLASTTLVVGCLDLPEQALIEEVRVLALRPAAPGEADGPELAEVLPGTEVTVDTLIVDPERRLGDDDVDALWLACPLGPNLPLFNCISGTFPTSLARIDTCPSGSVPQLPAPCRLPDGLSPTFAVPDFPGAALGVTMELTLVFTEGEPSLETCADAMLAGEYDTPDGCQYATHELAVGPRDVLENAPENLPPQAANTHPRVAQLDATVLDSGGEVLRELEAVEGTELTLAPDERVTLEIVTFPDDFQDYFVPVNNGESYTPVVETLKGEWLRTGGTFEGQEMDADSFFDDNLRIDWIPDGSGTTTVYGIVRDDRSGIVWTSIDLVVN